MRTWVLVVGVLVLAVPPLSSSGAQSVSIEQVLSRAADHVTAFREKGQVIIAEESYVQILRAYGVSSGDLPANSGESTGHKVRKLRSEFALVASASDQSWTGFRDVVEVDGTRVRDTADRLARAFADNPQTALAEARRIGSDAAKYNLGAIKRNVNVPTFGLLCLMPKNQAGFTFKKKGEKTVDGAKVWVLSYMETARPTLIVSASGQPMPTRGEVWIEPDSGRVRRTQVIVDALDAFPDMKEHPERYAAFPRIQIEVTYGLDARLAMWVPVEMKELYERQPEMVSCTATYSNFRRFETDAKVVVPK